MDKREYNEKLEEIKRLTAAEDYSQAALIADSIDWKRVRNVQTLLMISEIYEALERYEDSKALLLRAYQRSPVGRTVLYRLVEITVKLSQFDEAIEYYSEYVQAAPRDNNRYILKYKIYRGRGSSLDEQIGILKEYLDLEYNEQWAYELARLQVDAGRIQEAISTCDDLVLWFHSGKYVIKALELKRRYAPLTPKQQEIYDGRFTDSDDDIEDDPYSGSPYLKQAEDLRRMDQEKLQEEAIRSELARDISRAARESAQDTASVSLADDKDRPFAGSQGAAEVAAGAEAAGTEAAGTDGNGDLPDSEAGNAAEPEAAAGTKTEDTPDYPLSTSPEAEKADRIDSAAGEDTGNGAEDCDAESQSAGFFEKDTASRATTDFPDDHQAFDEDQQPSREPGLSEEDWEPSKAAETSDVDQQLSDETVLSDEDQQPSDGLGFADEDQQLSDETGLSEPEAESSDAYINEPADGKDYPEDEDSAFGSGIRSDYDARQMQEDLLSSMREIVSGVGQHSRDLEEDRIDEIIDQSKEEQENAVAERSAQMLFRVPVSEASAQRNSAAKLTIDDILLAMGDKGEHVRKITSEGTVMSADEEALMNRNSSLRPGSNYGMNQLAMEADKAREAERCTEADADKEGGEALTEKTKEEQAELISAIVEEERARQGGAVLYKENETEALLSEDAGQPADVGHFAAADEDFRPSDDLDFEASADADSRALADPDFRAPADEDFRAPADEGFRPSADEDFRPSADVDFRPSGGGDTDFASDTGAYSENGANGLRQDERIDGDGQDWEQPAFLQNEEDPSRPADTEDRREREDAGRIKDSFSFQLPPLKKVEYTEEIATAKTKKLPVEDIRRLHRAYLSGSQAGDMQDSGTLRGEYTRPVNMTVAYGEVNDDPQKGSAAESAKVYSGSDAFTNPEEADRNAAAVKMDDADRKTGSENSADRGRNTGSINAADVDRKTGSINAVDADRKTGSIDAADAGQKTGSVNAADAGQKTGGVNAAGAEQGPGSMDALDADMKIAPGRRPVGGKGQAANNFDERPVHGQDDPAVAGPAAGARIYGSKPFLKEYQKDLFKGFLGIGNMEEQIANAINQAESKNGDRTSRTGNVLILGAHGCGKTTIATGIAKAIAEDMGTHSVKMARIYAADLNRKDIAATIAKIAGGVLIIEEAGDLEDAIVDQLTTAMEFRTDSLIVILEDEQRYIHDMLMRHPRFTMKFTSQIYIPVFSNDDLVNFCAIYAESKDYVLDDNARATLYDRIDAVNEGGGSVSISNVVELVDHAISNANGFFRRIGSARKRYDSENRVILREKDFR